MPEILRIACAVASGLAAAHTAGVVHRDLKPANIMIGKDGEALIMDFGIAHSTGDAAASCRRQPLVHCRNLRPGRRAPCRDDLGSVVGTLEYMAPEQARGETIDHRADIYAFGLILYDVLLGRRRAGSRKRHRRTATPA